MPQVTYLGSGRARVQTPRCGCLPSTAPQVGRQSTPGRPVSARRHQRGVTALGGLSSARALPGRLPSFTADAETSSHADRSPGPPCPRGVFKPPAPRPGNIDFMAGRLSSAIDPGLHLENCNCGGTVSDLSRTPERRRRKCGRSFLLGPLQPLGCLLFVCLFHKQYEGGPQNPRNLCIENCVFLTGLNFSHLQRTCCWVQCT